MKQILLFIMLTFPMLASAQQGFEARWFNRGDQSLPYRILLPPDYKAGQKYPLILVLHGAGERGNDNEAQLKHGSKLFLNDTIRRSYPAIVVFPQCSRESFWAVLQPKKDSAGRPIGIEFPENSTPTPPAAMVAQLVDSLLASGAVDTKRVYIGGLSMGGMGTFDMLARYPDRFAAAFPICGGGNTTAAKRYAPHTALWIFHGDKDPIVPVILSKMMYDSLKQYGADVKYTEYPGVLHNSWDNAFAEPTLLPWLFSHQLKQ